LEKNINNLKFKTTILEEQYKIENSNSKLLETLDSDFKILNNNITENYKTIISNCETKFERKINNLSNKINDLKFTCDNKITSLNSKIDEKIKNINCNFSNNSEKVVKNLSILLKQDDFKICETNSTYDHKILDIQDNEIISYGFKKTDFTNNLHNSILRLHKCNLETKKNVYLDIISKIKLNEITNWDLIKHHVLYMHDLEICKKERLPEYARQFVKSLGINKLFEKIMKTIVFNESTYLQLLKNYNNKKYDIDKLNIYNKDIDIF